MARRVARSHQSSKPNHSSGSNASNRTQQRTPTTTPTSPAATVQDDPRVIERFSTALDDKLLLTPTEAARRLSISKTLCYRLLAKGELPSLVIGARLRRVPVQALDTYIQEQMAAAGL